MASFSIGLTFHLISFLHDWTVIVVAAAAVAATTGAIVVGVAFFGLTNAKLNIQYFFFAVFFFKAVCSEAYLLIEVIV
jgi:hypothetical protein